MGRNIGCDPPGVPDKDPSREKKWSKRCYCFKLITPMFGGGVESGKFDPVTDIRVPSVRGHLRFWWRALRGNIKPDPENPSSESTKEEDKVRLLKKREGEIWGSTDFRSNVIITLSEVQKGTNAKPSGNSNLLKYVTFPYKDDIPLADLTFKLEFEFLTKYEEDVMAAIWGWSNFGGIGGRTRRGAGSLYCADFAPPSENPSEIKDWLSTYCDKDKDACWPWPVFLPTLYIGPDVKNNPISVWEESVAIMRDFRQGEIGRNWKSVEGRRKAGRSRWPEADSIRRITGRHSRAEFGMPIIMKFKDDKKGDPSDTTILPSCKNEKERMSSPVILKALALQKGKYLPVCFKLKTPPLEGVHLDSKPASDFDKSSLENPSFATYHNSPMAGRSQKGSALEAFFAFAEERGFFTRPMVK